MMIIPCHVVLWKCYCIFRNHCFTSRRMCCYKDIVMTFQVQNSLFLKDIQFEWPLQKTTRMHSSRMRTARSLSVSRSICCGTHAPLPRTPPAMHPPATHAPHTPLPCTPAPLPRTPPSHTCPPAMYTPVPCMPPAMQSSPQPCMPPATHAPQPCMPPATNAPQPCMPPCHTCPPAMHAPLPCTPPLWTDRHL